MWQQLASTITTHRQQGMTRFSQGPAAPGADHEFVDEGRPQGNHFFGWGTAKKTLLEPLVSLSQHGPAGAGNNQRSSFLEGRFQRVEVEGLFEGFVS